MRSLPTGSAPLVYSLGQRPARCVRSGTLLLGLLLIAAPARAQEQDERQKEKAERTQKERDERAQKKEARAQAQREKKQAGWRKLPAYELGRAEALAAAAAECNQKGRVTLAPTPAGALAVPLDWRAQPLYSAPRARRPYVNGYLSCLRSHGHNPRFRGDLPVEAPPLPQPEEELPAQTPDEEAYLSAHAKELWDDGVNRCEADLRAKAP